jgi:phosphoribosylformylglycinamidine synthase
VDTVHDVSDGGLLVALAEMAMADGIGAAVQMPDGMAPIPFFFGEDQGRYLLAVRADDTARLLADARAANVPAMTIAHTAGRGPSASLAISEGTRSRKDVSLQALKTAHEGWFPKLMG